MYSLPTLKLDCSLQLPLQPGGSFVWTSSANLSNFYKTLIWRWACVKTVFILLAYIACRSIQVRKRAVVVGLNSDTEAHFIGSTHYYLVKFLAFSALPQMCVWGWFSHQTSPTAEVLPLFLETSTSSSFSSPLSDFRIQMISCIK